MWIHQVWFDLHGGAARCPCDGQRSASALWRDQNREHDYHLWSMPEALRLCDREYPHVARLLRADAGRWGIIKCDLFRYVLMHRFGGVYADLDFVPLRRLEEIRAELPGDEVSLFEEWPNSSREHPTDRDGTVHNGFLWSPRPGQAFWQEVISEALRRLGKDLGVHSDADVFRCTGTKMLRDVAVRWKDDVRIRRDYVVCPTSCAISYAGGGPPSIFDVTNAEASDRAFQALERMRGLTSDLPPGATAALTIPAFSDVDALRARFPHSLAVMCHFGETTSHWRSQTGASP